MVRAAPLLALFSTLLCASALACSQAATTADTAAPCEPPSHASGVVIAQIVTHDSKVAILGGSRDLRVVVRKLDGTMVADGISLAELRTRDPDAYTVVTSAFASRTTGTTGTSYVDATLDLGHLN